MIQCSWTPKGCSRKSGGTVLVSMLAVMAALLIVFLVALTIAVANYSRHVKAINRMTASFLADSGIQKCRLVISLSSEGDSGNRWQAPNGGTVHTRRHPWGPFVLAFSEGTYANQKVVTSAVLGATPSALLKAAIVVSEPDYPLVVSGTTTVLGDIITGPLGVTPGRFQGQDLMNEHFHSGNIIALQNPPVPQIDTSVLERYVREMQTRRAQGLLRLPASLTIGASDVELWQRTRSISVENNLFLNGMKSDRHDSIYSLFAVGRIEIGGQTNIRGTVEIVSKTSILVRDSVLIDQALLYANDSIVISGGARFSGIAISPHRIVVRDQAKLEFPAMLVVDSPSDSCSDSCGIFVRTSSPAEVSCIVLTERHSSRIPEPQIFVDTSVSLSGVLLSQGVVDLRGSISGSIWTSLFRFYSAPTTYINWIRNARVDRSKLTFIPALPIMSRDSVSANLHIEWQEQAKL